MRYAAFAIACCLTAGPTGTAGSAPKEKPPVEAILKVAAKAPPLPKPTGKVVRVADAAALRKAVASAKPGTTILLADGRYKVDRLRIRQDGLSLRGASGNRDKVILDGGGKLTRIVIVESGKDLLFADLTVANSTEYGIFFYGDAGAHRLRVHNVKFLNCLTRGLKGTDAAKVRDSWTHKHPPEKERQLRPIGGQVRYCLFINDRASPRLKLYRGDYIGGIDIMSAKDWIVADNVFVNIRGQRGGGRGAIFFWVKGENVVAERNLIVGCDRGICFGNPSGKGPHMTGGVIRNNFIVAGRSEAVEVCQARNTLVANNTLWCRQQKQRAVRFVAPVPGCRLVNNLIRGTVEAPAESKGGGNIVGELDGWFVNPGAGDLHLTAKAVGAVGKGRPLRDVAGDFDRQKRKPRPDLGADEVKADRGGARSRPARPSRREEAKPMPSTREAPGGRNPDVAKVLKVAAKAPALPKPKGPIVRVKTADALYKAVRSCKPGTTILLADGVYDLYGPVVISTDRVSLRGASGDREEVILDRGGGRGAIFMWVESEDVVVERNIIINCDRGICFGNPSGRYPHMTRGVARNNFIVAGAGEGVEVCQTRDVLVAHNTIFSGNPKHRAVWFHRGNPGGRFVNNLVRGAAVLPKDVAAESNIVGELDGWFVDPAAGDLHLTKKAKAALGKARALKEVADDFDGQKRKAASDVGADQVARRPGGKVSRRSR